jgi:hypothetical protein
MKVLSAMLLGLGCLCVAGGCQTRTRLVSAPPAPYFGPRLAAAPAKVAAPRASASPVRQVGWSDPGWDVGGPQRAWQFIVVHHSGTPTGSALQFDQWHRMKGWDELGYHFVIGNGTGSGDGEVEVGGRWTKQKHGAHCKVAGHPEYNDVGIGICLVGDLNGARPTPAQMASLARLVRWLAQRYSVPRNRIYGHGQLKATECPGRFFDYADLFGRL